MQSSASASKENGLWSHLLAFPGGIAEYQQAGVEIPACHKPGARIVAVEIQRLPLLDACVG